MELPGQPRNPSYPQTRAGEQGLCLWGFTAQGQGGQWPPSLLRWSHEREGVSVEGSGRWGVTAAGSGRRGVTAWKADHCGPAVRKLEGAPGWGRR